MRRKRLSCEGVNPKTGNFTYIAKANGHHQSSRSDGCGIPVGFLFRCFWDAMSKRKICDEIGDFEG